MLDPGSTTYRDLRVVTRRASGGSTLSAVCGEANSKNRLGGYVGYHPFVYIAGLTAARGVEIKPKDALRPGDWILTFDWQDYNVVDHRSLRIAEAGVNNQADFDDICKSQDQISDIDLIGRGNAITLLSKLIPMETRLSELEILERPD